MATHSSVLAWGVPGTGEPGLASVYMVAQSRTRSDLAAAAAHASKVMLKILQARLQQKVNLQMFKLDLEKAEEPEIKLPTSIGSSKKQENSRKTSTSAFLTMPKPLTV